MRPRRAKSTSEPVGYIRLVFFDDTTGEVVTLGGAGFLSRTADEAAWRHLKPFQGDSNFQAERLDAQREICDERRVSAQTCEKLLGQPIAALIAQGRAVLAAELRGYERSSVRLVVDNTTW